MLWVPFLSFKIVKNIICYVREAVNGGTNNRQSCHEQEMVSTHWFPTLSRLQFDILLLFCLYKMKVGSSFVNGELLRRVYRRRWSIFTVNKQQKL